ncbi:unnamed protein product [Spirodela intermedia]|uniref:Exonuclease domain-containing protein n=1 Tax=Spirodela intermedia TaxID=51605 RepID=A0A7I8IXN5_SPIIN|nr:unnamed protein product [Spirodela intermedia]CAA6661912.1 unnamed protein product [Spirodela intermedia]
MAGGEGLRVSWMAAEVVFFDVETTVPNQPGRRFWIMEFGAILVCSRRFVELDSYCTLIRPGDLMAAPETSGRSDGITRGAVAAAPTFEEVADRIFDVLNGEVWAGHNIQRFDCARIREAFADAGRAPPMPAGIVDSLTILNQQFGRRAGNLKMATLASYFGLGKQKHRSLDDVRMNLEVFKYCATVLLLESSLPQVLSNDGGVHGPAVLTRSRARGEELAGKSPPRCPTPAAAAAAIEAAKGMARCAGQGRPPSLAGLLRHSGALIR